MKFKLKTSNLKYLSFILFGCLVFCKPAISQHQTNLVKQLTDGKRLSVDQMSGWLKNRPGVIIFCPITQFDSSKYIAKAQGLANELSKKMYSGSSVYLVFFKIEIATNKNLELTSGNNKPKYVDEMEIVLVGADQERIERAKQLYGPDIFLKASPTGFEKLAFVDISPNAQCFSELPDRIPFVKDFLCDVLLPNYENRDGFNRLLNKLSDLDMKLTELTGKISRLESDNAELRKDISRISKSTTNIESEKTRLSNIIFSKEKELKSCEEKIKLEDDKFKKEEHNQKIATLKGEIERYKQQLNAL